MSSRNRFFRMLAYTIELLILYVIQETPGILGSLTGIKPVLMISAAVTIAMYENQKVSLVFGIVAGLLMDIGYGWMIGFNTLILSMLCYIIAWLATDYIQTNMLTAMLCTAVTLTIDLTAHYVFLYVLMNYGSNAHAYVHHYVPIIIYSIIPMPVMYLVNGALVKWCADNY